MNVVVLIGRLTKSPELKRLESGTSVVEFNIAIDRGKNRDGEKRGADFPRVKAFGKTAENIERFVSKGNMVGVHGRLETGSYKNKNGDMVYTTDVIADRVEFLEWDKPENDNPVPQGFIEVDLDDDVPY
jgi:single-strand DNA-binding protein